MKFAQFISELNTLDYHIIVANKGTSIDISELINSELPIHWDRHTVLESKVKEINGSAYISMKDCEVDTIININLQNIEATLTTITDEM